MCVCWARVTSGKYFNKPSCIHSDNDFYSSIKSMSYYILYKTFYGNGWHIICLKFYILIGMQMELSRSLCRMARITWDILSTTFSVVVVVVVVYVRRFVDFSDALHRERRNHADTLKKISSPHSLSYHETTIRYEDETICWMSFYIAMWMGDGFKRLHAAHGAHGIRLVVYEKYIAHNWFFCMI